MTTEGELLATVEAQFRHAAGQGAMVIEAGPFTAFLRQAPDPFYRSVAVPSRRARRWPAAIAALREVFAAHGRTVRLEFPEERWPDLAPALEAAGLAAETVLPIMARAEPGMPAQAGRRVELFSSATPPARLTAWLKALHTVFAQPLDPAAMPLELERLRQAIAAGDCRIAAATDDDGRLLSGAGLIGITAIPPGGMARRAAELAGVWTVAPARRRGLARAVSAALVRSFLGETPGLVWLTAGGEAAGRLYRGLGFREIGRQRTHASAASCGPARHATA